MNDNEIEYSGGLLLRS